MARTYNSTGFRGVAKSGNKFQAQIQHGGKYYYLGRFDTPQEAALAYDREVVKIKGIYAELNFE